MANTADISGGGPTTKLTVMVAGTGEDDIILDQKSAYEFWHDGETNAGVGDVNTIYLSTAASVDADESENTNKAKLMYGRGPMTIAYTGRIYFATEAGAPTFTIVRITD